MVNTVPGSLAALVVSLGERLVDGHPDLESQAGSGAKNEALPGRVQQLHVLILMICMFC